MIGILLLRTGRVCEEVVILGRFRVFEFYYLIFYRYSESCMANQLVPNEIAHFKAPLLERVPG